MLDEMYYEYCRSLGKSYFGKIMWAKQGDSRRHAFMQQLVSVECHRLGGRSFQILEVGSWAGGSAITWANALSRFNHGRGRVICVDPWRPYIDLSKVPEAPVGRVMTEALSTGSIYELFLYNVRVSGYENMLIPIKGASQDVLPLLNSETCDLLFVDGEHTYASVRKDLLNAMRLIREGGILCGDDLELQCCQVDVDYMKKNHDVDFIQDPATGQYYHPGVALAVGELFGEVSSWMGFWAMRRTEGGWEKVKLPEMNEMIFSVPTHLLDPTPECYKDFQCWLSQRDQNQESLNVC